MRQRRPVRFTRQMFMLQAAVVVVLLSAGMALTSILLQHNLEDQYEQRALTLARAVASDPELADLVRDGDQAAVQAKAVAAAQAAHALFVVVADRNGIRLAHPDPNQIGRRISSDPAPVLAGQDVADIARGTLGLSARGQVPLRDSTGTIVGEVTAGFAAEDIRRAQLDAVETGLPFAVVALLLGVAASAVLSRLLKSRTLGLEPSELSELVREREAVLRGIGEGFLAVDTNDKVAMTNAEAQRLLGREIASGTPVAELDLPPALAATMSNPESESVVSVAGSRVLVGRYRSVHHQGTNLGGVLTLADRTDLENLTGELDAVRSMTTALRAQRHEFANRMHTVTALLHQNSTEDALEYLQSVTEFTPADEISDSASISSATIRAFTAAKISHAQEKGVRLRVTDTSWVPAKIVAPVDVITVLGNLVDNAIDAARTSTRRPAEVEVDFLSDGDTLLITVIDTGDGVPRDQRSVIFESGRSTRGPQRGLGLAIARTCARERGGDVILTNPGDDGQPTVFVATLPGMLAGAGS